MKPIALTPGDPAGIGPDIVINLSQHRTSFPLVIIADPEVLLERAKTLAITLGIREYDSSNPDRVHGPGELSVLPVHCQAQVIAGRPASENSPCILDSLDLAISGCMDGKFAAMVTGPVNKAIINQAGYSFTGHTEYIAQKCNGAFPVMMLMNDSFRVALVTTHLPLASVPGAITRELLEKVIRIIHQDLHTKFNIQSPRLLVCGLNPHAGEQGFIGDEEIKLIEPVISDLKQDGIDLAGPVSADTAFTSSSLKRTDVVVCMYHDQGLPVLKSGGFGNIVNVTLGLPIIRTSVDHGTAFDLAGTGNADHNSLRAAIECAAQLSQNLSPA